MTLRDSRLTVMFALMLIAGALLCRRAIDHLMYSEDSFWRWFAGNVVYEPAPQVSPLSIPKGLDPTMLEVWFGGPITAGFRTSRRPDHKGTAL